jgi:hypothetical protein
VIKFVSYLLSKAFGGIFRLGGWAVVNMCVGGIDFVSFKDFSIGFCNCSNTMVFFVFLDFVTVPTVSPKAFLFFGFL